MKKIVALICFFVLFTGSAEAFINIRCGEEVHIINGTQYELEIKYETWSSKKTRRVAPGGDIVISSLRSGKHIIARAYTSTGEVVGVNTKKVRKLKSRDSQLWRISRIKKLR